MRAPIRPIRDRWPAPLELRLGRFFWPDPAILLYEDATPEEFRAAMSAIHVGDTIKITRSNRHPLSDALLVDNVDVSDARIVDIGASDGSTSVDLIEKLQNFKSYIIADLFLEVFAVTAGRRIAFYDTNDQLILVVGPRCVAWPSLSKCVRILYSRVAKTAARSASRRRVLLLNPVARALVAADSRVSYQVHDVFEVWHGPKPDVIKIANLLRRLYFSDERILKALRAILASLDEGGYLLVVDNPRISGIGERAGLYRRVDSRFALIERTTHAPEIDGLILQTTALKNSS